jgi:hypothetical protein
MLEKLKMVMRSTRGEVEKIITLAVALLVFAIIFPIAMQEVVSANTTGWQSSVATIFTVLVPILGALAVALLFIKYVKS